jgi:hypothetical protein
MEDKNKRYLDKVVDLLVSDTIIDSDRKEVHYPFESGYYYFYPYVDTYMSFSPSYRTSTSGLSFSYYCKDIYGLTDQEIEYVWDEYRKIIVDKLRYER